MVADYVDTQISGLSAIMAHSIIKPIFRSIATTVIGTDCVKTPTTKLILQCCVNSSSIGKKTWSDFNAERIFTSFFVQMMV
jgi:hypothetical protein